MRFLVGAHIDLRMLLQIAIERGRSSLRCTYDKEVGHCHTISYLPRKVAEVRNRRLQVIITAGFLDILIRSALV